MKKIVVLLLLLFATPAYAHVGSPDVFFDGDAGPYHLSIAIRTPPVIPGVATIEIRTEGADSVSVVPMRLTGPGSQLPPTPDRAERSTADPQLFTASLWLMERGSLQVRVSVDGARGHGVLAVPVAANARATLAMDRGLGALLFALMLVLALSFVAIAAGAAREVALEPGDSPTPRTKRRTRIAAALAAVAVTGAIALGNLWWNSEANAYAQWVEHPWHVAPKVDRCTLTIPSIGQYLLPDHGHEMHLFVVRAPALDAIAHLHPTRAADGSFTQALPSLPAGHYLVFADIVLDSGYPVTGTASIDLRGDTCAPLTGDDASATSGDPHIVFDRPPSFRAREATTLRFHVVNDDGTPATLEAYMGMAGHAVIMAPDGTVFAHIHPSGTVAMPALALASGPDPMAGMDMPMQIPSTISFPYGFPRPGAYRIFVQVKEAGRVLTGAFDAQVR